MLDGVPLKSGPRVETGAGAGADAYQGIGRRVKHHESVHGFAGGHVPCIAKPEFQGYGGHYLIAVLGEEIQGIGSDAARHISDCARSGVHIAIDEVGRIVKDQLSRIVVEIIVAEVTEFAPELEGVAPANVIQSVAEYGRQIAAALREVPLRAENKPQILDSDHGNELHIGTQRTPKIDAGRRRRIVRAEENVNAVHTQADLVHQGRRENVSLAEGENLAVALPGVPESRNVGALCGLLAKIVLIGVIAMDAIRIADVVADISGTLINVYRSRSRAEESW